MSQVDSKADSKDVSKDDMQSSVVASPDDTTIQPKSAQLSRKAPKEIGGPTGPDPVRYGDWEKAGRCIDF